MEQNVVTRIDFILSNNRNILKGNYDFGKFKVSELELIINGFNFTYHTSQLKHEDGNEIFKFFYEYGIGKLDNGYFQIIKLPF
jgi:hypothetical protein